MHIEIFLNNLFLSKLQAARQNSTQKEFLYNYFSMKVLQVLYSSFVVLSMGFYLKPQNFVRKKNNQVFVKKSPLSIIGSCVEKWCQCRKKEDYLDFSGCRTIVPETVKQSCQRVLNNCASGCSTSVPATVELTCQWILNNPATDF